MGKPVDVLVNLNVRMPRNLWQRVRQEAARRGVPIRDFVREACERHLARKR